MLGSFLSGCSPDVPSYALICPHLFWFGDYSLWLQQALIKSFCCGIVQGRGHVEGDFHDPIVEYVI